MRKLIAAVILTGALIGISLSAQQANFPPGGAGTGTVTSVTGSTPIVASASTTIPAISCPTCGIRVATGSITLNTTLVSSGACGTAQTSTATGTLTTDTIAISFNGDPTAVTGYDPVTTGDLTLFPYPTAGTVNIKVCNLTSASITPGAVTLNYEVLR